MDARRRGGATAPALRFADDRPPDVREAKPWHRYSHHKTALPRTLAQLAPELRVPPGGRVLDYGCADVPYRHLVAEDVDFVPADLEGNPNAALVLAADGSVPASDESFDGVLSTQVLEHVSDPRVYLAECHRVLRPGGRLLLSTHGIFVYHPDPVDLWRWTCAGLRREVEAAGFNVERFEGAVGLAATGLQLIEDSFHHRVRGRARSLAGLVMEGLIRLADRLESDEARRLNAQVFVLVAEKP